MASSQWLLVLGVRQDNSPHLCFHHRILRGFKIKVPPKKYIKKMNRTFMIGYQFAKISIITDESDPLHL